MDRKHLLRKEVMDLRRQLCRMYAKCQAPPRLFIPVPLPNIGKSGDKVKDYSKSVKVKKKIVAIKGASFCSIGDMASKGTGGGLWSSNTHGPCKFISPGSMDVKFEGGNVHLLSDLVTNNGGPSGSPLNAATMMGAIQVSGTVIYVVQGECPICGAHHMDFKESEETSDAAADVVSNYNGEFPCMIGVVECKCGKKYANKSGGMTVEFYTAAVGMHTIGSSQTRFKAKDPMVVIKMRKQLGHNMAFNQALRKAFKKSVSSGWLPPGACAAQGALVLAIDHFCVPKAMSEKWCSPEGMPTAREYQFYNRALGDSKRGELDARRFRHGESVPPCDTCNLLVPFLTCQEVNKCQHASVDYSCGGC